MALSMKVKIGDTVKLNGTGSAWTKDRLFTVTGVKSWGILCYTEILGRAYYRAAWSEIEGYEEP